MMRIITAMITHICIVYGHFMTMEIDNKHHLPHYK